MVIVWQFWLILAVVLLILELLSAGFYVICFSVGALVAALCAAFTTNLYVTLSVFIVVSLLCVFLVRPFVLKHLDLKPKEVRPSNADALMGQEGFISQAVDDTGFGRVAIDGDDWKCKSEDGMTIEKGTRVVVVARDSIILTVKSINK